METSKTQLTNQQKVDAIMKAAKEGDKQAQEIIDSSVLDPLDTANRA